MPRISGESKKSISYKAPEYIHKKIQELIDSGEFSSKNDVISIALQEFFDHRIFEERMDARIRAFLETEEGRELVRKAMGIV